MTESPFLQYGKLRLLNLPGAKAVYDEVLVEDCYRRNAIPEGALVFDVGAYCGEFALWCGKVKKCHVYAYEPGPYYDVARLNSLLNDGISWCLINGAIGRKKETRKFEFKPDSPVSSRFGDSGTEVNCFTLKDEIRTGQLFCKGPVVVKLDCEGAEREIFEDESWLMDVRLLMMEFHNKDGPFYREILARHGFELDTTDPNPEAMRAIIYAKRMV